MPTSWKRPKIQIPKTKMEWFWDTIGYSFYIGSIIFLLFIWNSLPAEVPAHYNALGEVDRWGAKWELIILLVIGGFLLCMMQVFEKFPEVHNYPKRFNESNAAEFYLNSRKMVNVLKNICLIIFTLILFESISIALGWGSGLGIWLLPMVILGTFIPIVIGLMQRRKIR